MSVIRHPFDVIGTLGENYSKFSPNKRRPQEEIRFWSELWEESYNFAYNYLKNNPSVPFASVKYEELCSDPMHVIKQVAERLHLEKINYASVYKKKINPSSRKYREFLDNGRVTQEQLLIIASVTEECSRRYNYDLDIS